MVARGLLGGAQVLLRGVNVGREEGRGVVSLGGEVLSVFSVDTVPLMELVRHGQPVT